MVCQLQCERRREKIRFEPLSENSITSRVGADVTTCGRLFQRRLPATGNARSPTVMSRVRRMTMNEVVEGWNRHHVGSNHIGSEEAVWCSGNALVLIALHRARLVLGWVTAFG